MNDAIDMLFLHEFIEGVEVADVHFHKLIVRFIFHIFKIGQITCISEFIEVDDVILRILVHEQAHYMASYKACATSNDDCFHIYLLPMVYK